MSAMAMGGCDSLWSALAAVRDHRGGAGRRYPLPGLLLIAVAALLAGRRDQLGIVRWARVERFGFGEPGPHPRRPGCGAAARRDTSPLMASACAAVPRP